MDRVDEEGGETFGFPLTFKCEVWLGMIVGPGLVLLSLYLLYVPHVTPPQGYLVAVIGLFFATLTLYTMRVLRRLPEKIHVDDRAIRYETPDGEVISLPWDHVSRVVDRPLSQRIEVYGKDGFTIIRVENQLERFDRLREIILERSAWDESDEIPDLPATFSRPWVYLVASASVTLFMAGFGLVAIYARNYLGFVFILLGLMPWLDWLTIRVDHSVITFRNIFRKRRMPVERIEDVQLETLRQGHGSVFLGVLIKYGGGKVRKIYGVHEGSLNLYRTLLQVWPPAS